MAILSADYKYEDHRAVITLYDEGNPVAKLTVAEATKLAAELIASSEEAFYDFTASTPNRASQHHWLNR